MASARTSSSGSVLAISPSTAGSSRRVTAARRTRASASSRASAAAPRPRPDQGHRRRPRGRPDRHASSEAEVEVFREYPSERTLKSVRFTLWHCGHMPARPYSSKKLNQRSVNTYMARQTGDARLPLHHGRAPAWLFTRMTRLAREMAVHIVADQGAEQLLRRLSDPFWFQAFGCVLGFDWHSSGVTTTVTGALKEGLAAVGGGAGTLRPGREGSNLPKDAGGDRRALRPAGDGPDTPRVREPHGGEGGQRRRPGWLPALSSRVFLHSRRPLVRRAAGDERPDAQRPAGIHWLSESLHSFVNDPHEPSAPTAAAPRSTSSHPSTRRSGQRRWNWRPDRPTG